MIKFMVLDVDGTITDQNRIISPEAIKSVRHHTRMSESH